MFLNWNFNYPKVTIGIFDRCACQRFHTYTLSIEHVLTRRLSCNCIIIVFLEYLQYLLFCYAKTSAAFEGFFLVQPFPDHTISNFPKPLW